MSDERLSLRCGDEDAGKRLDKFLNEHVSQASRSQIQKWIEAGLASVNGIPAHKNFSMSPGDKVDVIVPQKPEASRLTPENIPLNIVYEDEYLAVVDKPKGMVTHPGNGVHTGTLAQALAYHFKSLSDVGGSDRPGIVHRLDRDTTGLLVVARDNATHSALSQQLSEHRIRRTYQALCWRELTPPDGTYRWPLWRHTTDPLKRAVREDGKPAVTHYHVLNWFHFVSHVEVHLETGRTHQIRVHLSHAGYPVAGDALYGGRDGIINRTQPLYQAPAAGLLKRLSSQALHAANLSFTHPHTRKNMDFKTPLPREFLEALEYLKPYQRKREELDA